MRPKDIDDIIIKARKRMEGLDLYDENCSAMVWLSAYELNALIESIEDLEEEVMGDDA